VVLVVGGSVSLWLSWSILMLRRVVRSSRICVSSSSTIKGEEDDDDDDAEEEEGGKGRILADTAGATRRKRPLCACHSEPPVLSLGLLPPP
jgi:hypothetical protein